MRPTTILLLAPVLYAHAQLTIFLPGFDEQPLVADVAGTEGGRTTYFVHNTETNPDLPADGFFGTATVIQGPTDASIHYELGDQVTVDTSCTWTAENIEQAVCTAANPGGETEVVTTALPLMVVQQGTTVAGPAATSAPSASPGSSTFQVDSTALTKPSASRSSTPGVSGSAGVQPTDVDDSSASRTGVSVLMFCATVASFWLL